MMAVRAVVAALGRAGLESSQLLAAAEVDAEQLDDVHARVPLADYRRVVRGVLEATQDPALGLHMGEHGSMTTFDALGHLTQLCPTLREALAMSSRYARIVTDGPQLELTEHDDLAILRMTLSNEDAPEVRVAAEFSTISLLHLIRRFVGEEALAHRVLFAYPAPAHQAEYTRLFAGREQFSQPFTGLEFERAWLDRTQPYRSDELRDLLQARAEVLLAKVDRETSAAERVKRWLLIQSPRTRPTMDAVARDLGMSARSLRRRLHRERTPFGAVVDDALAVHAKRLLGDPRESIQDVAYAMGFATPSAFSRAFKRWTGGAPSAFRGER
jgi:AraC-like DNA-binding protein